MSGPTLGTWLAPEVAVAMLTRKAALSEGAVVGLPELTRRVTALGRAGPPDPSASPSPQIPGPHR